MALTYSRFMYGWEVIPSGAPGANDKIDFNRGGVKSATIPAGVYTPDELALEVGTALEAADSAASGTWTCSFSWTTRKFTIGVGESFTLLWGTGGNKLADLNALLGFDASDHASVGNAATSDREVGDAPNPTDDQPPATAWVMVEPNEYQTPVVPQTNGASVGRGKRRIRAFQNIADGGLADTIFLSRDKLLDIGFRALTSTEADKMESFLNWVERGRRFTWQPDKDAESFVKLVLADPAQVNPDFEWLTRSEITYGRLTFLEQTSRI